MLIVSAVRVAGQYRSCDVYRITDPPNATVADSAEVVLEPTRDTNHFGMCTYHRALTESGMILSELFEATPYIRLQATSVTF